MGSSRAVQERALLTDAFEYTRDRYTKDGTAFYLRPACPSDCEVIVANIQAVCAEQVHLFTDTFVLTDEWRQVLANPVNEDSGHLLVVAQVGQEVIGYLRLFAAWYGSRGRHVGEVGLAVARPWRERGIGTAMMVYALDWAAAAWFQKIIASVIATNRQALNLFAKFDFMLEGRRARQFHIAGQYVDEVLLGRFVDGTSPYHLVSVG